MADRENRVTRGGLLLRKWLEHDNSPRQSDFASELGVTQSAISNLVRGYQRPSLTLACLIQARTRAAVRVTDWLDDEEASMHEGFERASNM